MRIRLLCCVCDILMTRSTIRSHAGELGVSLPTWSYCSLIAMVSSVTRLVELGKFFAPYRNDRVWDREYTTSAIDSWTARLGSTVTGDVW